MLVRAGWSADEVLDFPMDTFTEVLLICQKQQLQLQMQLGLTIMTAASSLFSKDGAKQAMDHTLEQIDRIDGELTGDGDDEDEYDEPVQRTARPRRKKQRTSGGKPDQQQVIDMARKLHGQFQNLMLKSGGRAPETFDRVVDKSLEKGEKLAKAKAKQQQQQ